MRQFAPVEYAAVKTTTQMLVQSLGGVDAAAGVTRVGRSQLSDYGLLTSDKFCPVDVLMDMEHVAATPVITSMLARIAGFSLVRILPARAKNELAALLARIGKDTGDLFATAAHALGHKTPTPVERRNLLRELEDLKRAAEEAIQWLSVDHEA